MQNYSRREIFDKNLLFFIPYYILKFEKQLESIDSSEETLNTLLIDYQEIYQHLKQLAEQEYIDSDYLHNLLNLIQKLIDVVAHDAQNFRRKVTIMGGQVLELPSEKIRAEAWGEAWDEAWDECEAQVQKKIIFNMHNQGHSLKTISDATELSIEEIETILNASESCTSSDH